LAAAHFPIAMQLSWRRDGHQSTGTPLNRLRDPAQPAREFPEVKTDSLCF
jgi:hypothetical protein